jgi:pseudouridine-5'-phosphate glycosidase
VSADLVELARTEVLVVAAGIKSLLEMPSTMEVSRRSAFR